MSKKVGKSIETDGATNKTYLVVLINVPCSCVKDDKGKIKEPSSRTAASCAAKKAWKTIKSREAKMSPSELEVIRLRRSRAAKKAWKTIRSRKA